MQQIKKIVAVTLLSFMWLAIAAPSDASVNYKEAREQYKKEKKVYKESKDQFLKERKKVRELKDEKNKARYEETIKKHLERVVDVLVAKLNRIESWVNNRKALPDEEKQKIITEINNDKAWLEAKKSRLNGASKEELRTAAKEIREYWKESRFKIKKVVGQVLVGRVNITIEKADEAVVRIDSAINSAKDDGRDVANAEKLLADLKVKLDSAKKEVENARRAFDGISSIQDADKFFREGNRYLKSAHSYLKEVRRIGRAIIVDLRG